MSGDFEGKVVVTTGASTGLGRAVSVGVARRGAEAVVINYARSAEEADETAALVEAAGAKALVVKGDVGEDEECKRIVAAAAPYGRIDVLFNNAGITKFAGDHSDMDAVDSDDFIRLYKVNVIGAFQMIRAAKALLLAGPQPGAVVNTSSIAGVMGIGSSVPYAASKGALTTMTLSLARALAPKIRVNAVCPGYVDTPWFGRGFSEDQIAKIRERTAATTPLNVVSTADDIAPTMLFLASAASLHITGETIIIDGGVHLGAAPLTRR